MDVISLRRLLIISILIFSPASLLAATIDLSANIDGNQANAGAGSGSSGTGFASMTLDTDTNLFSWDINWSGLTGAVTSAHFHGPALPDTNGGVQLAFDAFSTPSIGSATITTLQADDLLAGLWYINIHTDFAPGGEIRGQVQVVPVPAAIWLFGSGLLGLVGALRRRA